MIDYKSEMNRLGGKKVPFLFIIDYLQHFPIIHPLKNLPSDIFFDFNNFKRYPPLSNLFKEVVFKKYPVSFEKYSTAFNTVVENEEKGNSYLVNLTFPTEIETNLSLAEIFTKSQAKYKLLYKNNFVVFSPETFVTISNGTISSFPMKGTIAANIPDAQNLILKNEKEAAEHATIVDLIRNDISQVAEKVWVERFRYVEEVKTLEKNILQVSSQICGTLPRDYPERIGDIVSALLPAGSVTGAPKPKTLEIIKEAEGYERGYYTGIFGFFDGENLDSAVMIRFIENQDGRLVYKSGGGITVKSNVKEEYEELKDKVYLPFISHHPKLPN